MKNPDADGGAICLPRSPLMAADELWRARALGIVPLSSATPQLTPLWLMQTDTFHVSGMAACGLWTLFSLLGRSPSALGVRSHWAVREPPATLMLRQLASIFEMARQQRSHAPAAALHLMRARVAGWRVLYEDTGLFILTGWVLRRAESKSHYMGYNAGCRILYVGPDVELVTEDDLEDLDMFAARIYSKYGVYVTETCQVRVLHLNPLAQGAAQLGYATPAHIEEVAPSKSWRRRQKRKRKRGASK